MVARRSSDGAAGEIVIDLIAAVAVLAEIDLSRFQNPRELMGSGVPSESSTGDKVKRGGVTKAGNGRARRTLGGGWSYRYPPRVSREKQPKVAVAPRRVREIAWKAQTRCVGASGHFDAEGQPATVVATAVARGASRLHLGDQCGSWHRQA